MFKGLENYDIILILGNYGAGKSHFSKTYFPDRKRINRLEIRHMLKSMTEHGKKWNPDEWNEDIDGLVKHIEQDIIHYYLDRNIPITIDNTSLTKKSRKRYIEIARHYKKTIACIFLNRDISYLIEQNRKRNYPVPDHLIVKLYSRTEIPTEEEGFDALILA